METKFIYAVDFLRSKNLFKIIILFATLYFIIFKFSGVFEAKQTYYTVETYGPLNSSKVTVISLYFQLNKSKHSPGKYQSWIKNFFQSVSSPLVIFTDKESIKDLLEIRNRNNYQTTLYVADNIWKVMDENGRQRKRNYTHNYQNRQHSLDREKKIHNPNLYAIWNLKPFIADLIAQDNLYNSSAFIYTDSGAWRSNVMENWPDQNVTMSILNILNDKVLLGQLRHEGNASNIGNNPDYDLIQGAFFMGTKNALHNFKEGFWLIHDTRYDKGDFVGKEQVLMNLYAYKTTNSIKLDMWRRKCNLNGWFFYRNYFASNKYYPCASTRESLLSINRT